MKDIKVVLENLSNQGIDLDSAQTSFLEEFIEQDAVYKAPKFFSKNNSIGNLYLWGPVGRGKTMLLQALQDSYFSNASQFHFIEFMQLVHKKLSEYSGNSDPLIKVVKSLSDNSKIIFIDEFQIEDIADAMIIGTIIEKLSMRGTRLIISSNSHPNDLYKDGLQRSKFLKTVNFVNKNFFVHNLLGSEDYRLKEIAKFDSSAKDGNGDKEVKGFLHKTFSKDLTDTTELIVNNRKFDCLGLSDKALWLSLQIFSLRHAQARISLKLLKHLNGYSLIISMFVMMIILIKLEDLLVLLILLIKKNKN